jgi:hypothetical protein
MKVRRPPVFTVANPTVTSSFSIFAGGRVVELAVAIAARTPTLGLRVEAQR